MNVGASRAEAVARLRAAREKLEAARSHARWFGGITEADATIALELNAAADAELCAACEALGETPPAVTLLPTLVKRRFIGRGGSLLSGEGDISWLSLLRVRRWIGARIRRIDGLLALHVDHGDGSGPYR